MYQMKADELAGRKFIPLIQVWQFELEMLKQKKEVLNHADASKFEVLNHVSRQ